MCLLLFLMISVYASSIAAMDAQATSTSQPSMRSGSSTEERVQLESEQECPVLNGSRLSFQEAIAQWSENPLDPVSGKDFFNCLKGKYPAADNGVDSFLDAVLKQIDNHKKNLLHWFLMRQLAFELAREFEEDRQSKVTTLSNGSSYRRKSIGLPFIRKERESIELVINECKNRIDQPGTKDQFEAILNTLLQEKQNPAYKRQFVSELTNSIFAEQRHLTKIQKVVWEVLKKNKRIPRDSQIPAERDNNIGMLIGEVNTAVANVGNKNIDNQTLENIAKFIKDTANHYNGDRRLLYFSLLSEKTIATISKEKNRKIIKDIAFNYILDRFDRYEDEESNDLLELCVSVFPFNEYEKADKNLLRGIKGRGRLHAIKKYLPDLDEEALGDQFGDQEDESIEQDSSRRLSVTLSVLGIDPINLMKGRN